jgi:choline dehydrogenase-like flavoprotein
MVSITLIGLTLMFSDQSRYPGTTNIRVADASIMPISVSPHTTLGLYGIGEKAADMILKTASAQLLPEDV